MNRVCVCGRMECIQKLGTHCINKSLNFRRKLCFPPHWMCVLFSSIVIDVSSPISRMVIAPPVACSILMSVMPSCMSFFTNKSTSKWPHSYLVFRRTSSRVGGLLRLALDVPGCGSSIASSNAYFAYEQ